MIYVCPNCGHSLDHQLSDGLTFCSHCNRVVESSPFNRLLSASWMVRKHHYSLEQLKEQAKIPNDEALLIMTFVADNCYSHEDFTQFLTNLGVSKKSY